MPLSKVWLAARKIFAKLVTTQKIFVDIPCTQLYPDLNGSM